MALEVNTGVIGRPLGMDLNISFSSLFRGTRRLALIAQPALVDKLKKSDNFQFGYYAWVTRFPVVQNQQQEVLQNLKILNLLGKGQESWQIKQAIQRLEASLAPGLWLDSWTPGSSGKKIFDAHQKAVHELLKSRSEQPIVTQAINTLVKADETLAINAMVDAVAKGGAPKHLLQARKNMERAREELKAERLTQAIIFYGKAWEQAEKAAKMAKAQKPSSNQ